MDLMPWVSPQPIDKICVGDYQLFCLPNKLKLVRPEMNNYQAPTFQENKSVDIKQLDFLDFLHFLCQCCQLISARSKEPENPRTYEHEAKFDTYLCRIVLLPAKTELVISNEHTALKFEKKYIPLLMAAITRILFKSYCYSHNVNYLVQQYIAVAEADLIKEPNFDKSLEIFHQLNHPYIDMYLLYDIVERHKKLLYYLKTLSLCKEIQ